MPPVPDWASPARTPKGLSAEIHTWLDAPALHRLVEASELPWPTGTPGEVRAVLARATQAWDFRGGDERHLMSTAPAVIGGRELDEAFVRDACAELGLVATPLDGSGFTHVVVLGGMARACRSRSLAAAELRAAHAIPHAVVLSAHRPLAGNEPSDAVELGWGDLTLESEAAMAAAIEAFAPPGQPTSEVHWEPVEVPDDQDGAELRRRRSWAHHRWTGLDLVVAASRDPEHRRANTSDQLVAWAAAASIGSDDQLLLVTTEHYVPYQHSEAIRVLGLQRGCGITTTGVPWNPPGAFRGRGFLQEVRGAVLSMVALHDAIDAIDATAGA